MTDKSKDELDTKFIDSIAWSVGAKIITQAISWISFLFTIRLLSPNDYGLLGMTSLFLGFMTLLSEFGVGSTVVNLRNLSRYQIKQLSGLSLIIASCAVGLTFLLSGSLASFFRNRDLVLVLQVMSAGFFLSGMRAVPNALLKRDLEYRSLAFLDSIHTLVQSLLTVLLAALGFHYWALVFGGLSGSFAKTVLSFHFRGVGFAIPNRRSIGEAIRFSYVILLTQLCWMFYSNADYVVAGRLLGTATLGIYTLALTLSAMPAEKILSLITQVAPGFFSVYQDDHAALRRYLFHLTRSITFFTFPAIIGIALLSNEIVAVFLGAKWAGVAGPLSLLCVYTAVSSPIPLLSPLLVAVGYYKVNLWFSILRALILPGAFYIGSRWGAAGIAAAWVVTYPILTVPLFLLTLKAIDMRAMDYWKALQTPLLGSLVMSLFVSVVRFTLRETLSLPALFAVGVSIGVASYTAYMALFARDDLCQYRSKMEGWLGQFTNKKRDKDSRHATPDTAGL